MVLADERLNSVSPRGKVAQFEDSIAVALCGICLAILIAYAQGALLGTLAPALAITFLSGLRNGSLLHPLDAAETVLLLCPVTAVSCGPFGLLAGAAGGTAIYLRKRRIHSSKRLLAESAIAGFLMGCLFPFFDAAVNSFFLKSFQPLVIPGQIILYPVLGIPCALIQHNHLPNEI